MTNLFVISAPSGTGKTSLIKRALIDLIEQKIKLSTSYTTRKRRPEEKNGESYYFITKEEFEYMISKGDFVEHAEVFGNLYGTHRTWVEEQIKSGFNIVLELDWQGALQIKSRYTKAKTIFVVTPSYKDLEKRLKERDQDSIKDIEHRLAEAKKEISEGVKFDYLLLNDNFEEAVKDLKGILMGKYEIKNTRLVSLRASIKGWLEQ